MCFTARRRGEVEAELIHHKHEDETEHQRQADVEPRGDPVGKRHHRRPTAVVLNKCGFRGCIGKTDTRTTHTMGCR